MDEQRNNNPFGEDFVLFPELIGQDEVQKPASEPVTEEASLPEQDVDLEPEAGSEAEVFAEEAPVEELPPLPWESDPEPEDFRQEPELPGEETPKQAPVYYACPVTPQEFKPEKQEKKKKKKRRGIGVFPMLLLCLACAIVGGLLGGLLGGGGSQPGQDNASLEARIEALEESAEKAPQQQEYDAQPNIAATQVYENNVTSVVGITNGITTTNIFGQSSSVASTGSGFIVRDDGYVVTNYHVVQGAQTLHVTLYNGMEHPATLIGYDSGMDVALLKIEAPELDAVTVGDSDLLRVGDQVAAIGNPLGELTLTMTVGYISALDREINTDGVPINMLQTDAAINSGNSGGPLFDMKGNVIGITTAKYSGSTSSGASIEGIGFAVPINDVMLIVEDLLDDGMISGRAYLGITAMDMDAQTAEMYSLPVGAYVNSVVDGSCAQKAGVQAKDIILSLGQYEISSYNDLARALREFAPGDAAEIRVYRAGAELSLTVIFDERPSEEELTAQDQQTQTPQPETQPMPEDGQQGTMPFGYGEIPDDMEDMFRYFFGN